MTDEQLREWAYRTGDADVGAAVIRLLVDMDALRIDRDEWHQAANDSLVMIRRLQEQIDGHCERIAAQSAEKSGSGDADFEVGPTFTMMHPTNPQPGDPVIEKFDGTYPMRSTVADFRSHEGGI